VNTRLVDTEQARMMAVRFIQNQPLPFAMRVTKDSKRSIEQNRLQFLWVKEASEQLQDHTPEQYRAYCKLHYGVPILRNDDDQFRTLYDEMIRPLSYENKLKLMSPPIDLPITSQMTVKQLTQYLNEVHAHFSSLGVVLTDPEDRKWRTFLETNRKEVA